MNKNVVIAVLIALLIGNAMGFAIGKSVGGATPSVPVASSTEAPFSSSLVENQPAKPAAESEVSTAPVEAPSSSSSLEAKPSNSSVEDQSSSALPAPVNTPANTPAASSVSEDGSYTSKDDVAAYIHEFGHLPPNYISKSKAKKAGWVAKEGNLDKVLPGMSIGGSEFYNDEGQLPDAPGRTWTECDINYEGGFRGAERIVFSNDGLIFYTADHYKTFEQLY